MNIALGGDHASPEYKSAITEMLIQKGHSVKDFGTHGTQSVDYPDHVHPVADAVQNGQADLGIIICGSGNGAAMTANKHQGIRAALCWNKELVELARQHNNANILSLPARFISKAQAVGMADAFITTDFEGGRHQRRIDKIPC